MTDYLAENRSRNWAGISDHTPDFVKNYVRAFREAQVEERSISPVFLKSHTAGIEQRSAVAAAAMRTVNRQLFPTKAKRPACAPASELAVWRSIAHRQSLELREDAKVLSRARLDSEARREAEALAESIAAENRRCFPWERRS